MISMEDFYNKGGPKRGPFKNWYVDRIAFGSSKKMRILEKADSVLFKKFEKQHEYLQGIGNISCDNTREKAEAGHPCPFCKEFVTVYNNTVIEHFNWLKTTSIVNKAETDKFNEKVKELNIEEKIILRNSKMIGYDETFAKEIFDQLTPQEKIQYNEILKKRDFVKMKIQRTLFFIPVYDYGLGEIKIYRFTPSVYNALENQFTKAGYEFTSADVTITCNGGAGSNYWGVSRGDTSPISDEIFRKYEISKEEIRKELERRCKILSIEEYDAAFKKYKEALSKKELEAAGGSTPPSSSAPLAQPEIPVENKADAPEIGNAIDELF
jgi:hypothetical protein